MVEGDASSERLGLTVIQAGGGTATVNQTIVPNMANALGIAQGGFVFALADQAFAYATNSVNEGTATAEASISYLSPARVGDTLVANAKVSYSDARRVVVDVTVKAGENVVALFRGTGKTFRSKN